jgi:ankyrin repeat protein
MLGSIYGNFTRPLTIRKPPRVEGDLFLESVTSPTLAGAGSGAAADSKEGLTFTIKDAIEILNSYYLLEEENERSYPEELREYFNFWHSNYIKSTAYNAQDLEIKRAQVKETIDAIAIFLESRGIDARKYKEGSTFYSAMLGARPEIVADTDDESTLANKGALYQSRFITTFMKEALGFVNLVSKQLNRPGLEEEKREKVAGFLSMFPSDDKTYYQCLAGVRDAQIYVYMLLKTQEMPWVHQLIVKCHRNFIEKYRKEVEPYIDPKYQVHIFSAIECLLGIESKEPDTLETMKSIPARIACKIIYDYAQTMQNLINKQIFEDVKMATIALEEANSKGADKFKYSTIQEIQDVFWSLGFSKFKDQDIEIYLREGDDETATWSTSKALKLFEDKITFLDDMQLPRPAGFFDRESKRRLGSLLASRLKDERDAGFYTLSLLITNAEGNDRIFLDYINDLTKYLLEIEEKKSFLSSHLKESPLRDLILRYYDSITKTKTLTKSLDFSAKDFFYNRSKGLEDRSSIITTIRSHRIECLKELSNFATLENLFSNPNLFLILNLLINDINFYNSSKKEDLAREDLIAIGSGLLYLGIKFNDLEVFNYAALGFQHPTARAPILTFPHFARFIIENGLLKRHLTLDGEEITGLEYLAIYNPDTIIKNGLIHPLILEPLSNNQNLIHKLAKKGDSTTMDRLLMIPALILDLNLQDRNGKTALHLAIENAIKNPEQIGAIGKFINESFNVDIADEEGKTVIDLAFEAKNPEIYRAIKKHFPAIDRILLHKFIEEGNLENFNLALDGGADPKKKHNGLSSLDLAVYLGRKEIIKSLIHDACGYNKPHKKYMRELTEKEIEYYSEDSLRREEAISRYLLNALEIALGSRSVNGKFVINADAAIWIFNTGIIKGNNMSVVFEYLSKFREAYSALEGIEDYRGKEQDLAKLDLEISRQNKIFEAIKKEYKTTYQEPIDPEKDGEILYLDPESEKTTNRLAVKAVRTAARGAHLMFS